MDSESKAAIWVGVVMTAVLGFALGVVPHLLPGEDDDAVRNVQAFFNTVAMREPLGVYNSLHPELQQRVSFARCGEVMAAYREMFGKLKAQRASPAPEGGAFNFDVEADFVSHGQRHVLQVEQRTFSGMRRITDGEIQSLSSATQLPMISDIRLDGRSIF